MATVAREAGPKRAREAGPKRAQVSTPEFIHATRFNAIYMRQFISIPRIEEEEEEEEDKGSHFLEISPKWG